MKKILNIIVVAVLAMVSFTSCDKGLVTEMEAEGKVSLKGLVVSVLNNEDERDFLVSNFSELGLEVECGIIDYTMGAHCGPRTIAIFYRRK